MSLTRPVANRRHVLLLGAAAAATAAAGKALGPRLAEAAENKTMITGVQNPNNGSAFTAAETATTTLTTSLAGVGLVVTNAAGMGTYSAFQGIIGPSPSVDSAAAAVVGKSMQDGGIGIKGLSTTTGGTGVVGVTEGIMTASGVHGLATNAGIGVWAESTGMGPALQVSGDASFSGPTTAVSGTLYLADSAVSSAGPLSLNSDLTTPGSVAASSFAGGGSGLTALNASELATGTIPNARIPASIPRTNAPSNAFTGPLSAASFSGNGASLTALNASNISAGTLSDARLSSNVLLKSGGALTLTGNLAAPTATISGPLTIGSLKGAANKALSLAGSGTGVVLKGNTASRVSTPLCKSTSKVLVTLQSNPKGAAVAYVKPGNGFFDVTLTADAGAAAKFAYLILA